MTGGAGGTVIINGGQVTATSPLGYGIGSGKSASGTDGTASNITLGWTAADDFIKATSFAGTVTLDKTFFYEDKVTGVTLDNLASHAGEKIIPSTATTANNLAYATISAISIRAAPSPSRLPLPASWAQLSPSARTTT